MTKTVITWFKNKGLKNPNQRFWTFFGQAVLNDVK